MSYTLNISSDLNEFIKSEGLIPEISKIIIFSFTVRILPQGTDFFYKIKHD